MCRILPAISWASFHSGATARRTLLRPGELCRMLNFYHCEAEIKKKCHAVVHTLLRLDDEHSVFGHPVAGASWEGFVVETLIRAAPDRTQASFYRTATGVEIELVLELPGDQVWPSRPSAQGRERIPGGPRRPETR